MAEDVAGQVHGGHEIHQEEHERFGKMVGLSVSLIGVILAVITIASHRAHTAAVIKRTEVNDQWAYYQAKRTREYMAEIATALGPALASDSSRVQGVVDHYTKERDRYTKESKEIEQDARTREKETENEESRALLLDMSEGFFELGLVLSSVYFLARRRYFPFLGGLAALIGAGFGVLGFMGIGILGLHP
jgi:hypothetical protein